MTRKDWCDMTGEAKRIKVAELCGWEHCYVGNLDAYAGMPIGKPNASTGLVPIPNYLHDLNAIHEAEKLLQGDAWHEYAAKLKEVSQHRWHATAAQRAEAFVLTMDGRKCKVTREQWAKLTPEEQRIKVAELCGFTKDDTGMWKSDSNTFYDESELPDYLNDLNAMHEAEKLLPDDMDTRCLYVDYLTFTCEGTWMDAKRRLECATATAAQRAEAFVLTMEGGAE